MLCNEELVALAALGGEYLDPAGGSPPPRLGGAAEPDSASTVALANGAGRAIPIRLSRPRPSRFLDSFDFATVEPPAIGQAVLASASHCTSGPPHVFAGAHDPFTGKPAAGMFHVEHRMPWLRGKWMLSVKRTGLGAATTWPTASHRG